ncbi:MAG: hypothetical protein ACREMA_15285, partial [Longimicrobiales bacterium]
MVARLSLRPIPGTDLESQPGALETEVAQLLVNALLLALQRPDVFRASKGHAFSQIVKGPFQTQLGDTRNGVLER